LNPTQRITVVLKRNDPDRPGLIAYLTGGYPDEQRFKKYLLQIAAESDLVEVGVPFSDPIADGLTIQHASRQALRNGVSLTRILEWLAAIRTSIEAPVVLMSYLNPLLAYGYERLADDSVRAGVSGFIVPDLPMEESVPLAKQLDKHDLALVQLVTPVTPIERIKSLCEKSQGFVYAVTQAGTTGGDRELPRECANYLGAVRKLSSLPVFAGFGIRTRGDVERLAGHVDGIVVGSALIDAIAAGTQPDRFLRSLRI
jgi:tryptophan synthase alpha chain